MGRNSTPETQNGHRTASFIPVPSFQAGDYPQARVCSEGILEVALLMDRRTYVYPFYVRLSEMGMAQLGGRAPRVGYNLRVGVRSYLKQRQLTVPNEQQLNPERAVATEPPG